MQIEGQRADRSEVIGIKSFRRGDGTYLMSSGLNGPNTLIKEVAHYTMHCPECGTVAYYDDHGQAICNDGACAVVVSDKPMLVREDFGEGGAGHGVAEVDTSGVGGPEPNVQ